MGDDVMKRIITVLISAVLLVAALSGVTSFASGTRVLDKAGLLTDSEAARVDTALADAEARTGYSVRLYTTTTHYVSESRMLSDLGFDDGDDLVVLSIECWSSSTYYYELFTFGDAYGMISDSDAERILDDDRVYAIKRGKIESSAVAFASLTAETVETNRLTRRVMGVAIPILLALATAGIFVGVVCYTYKRKLKSPIYPVTQYASLSLSHSSDNYITSTVTRVRVQSSSGRGGGSRGGGSRGRR